MIAAVHKVTRVLPADEKTARMSDAKLMELGVSQRLLQPAGRRRALY
jgi:hypothetical protein